MALEIFPSSYIKPYTNIAVSVSDAMNIDEYNEKIRWAKRAPDQTGVVHMDESAMDKGLVLYTTTHDTTVRLIDEDGNMRHRWALGFNEIWPDQEQVIALKHLDDSYFYARDAHLFDNGDLITLISAGGITPWGMGLVKVDRNGALIWRYTGYINNDFEMGPDGEIYAIEHVIRDEDLQSVEIGTLPFLSDQIVTISSDGEKINEISLLDAIEASPFINMLRELEDNEDGDPTHSNAIEYVREDNPDIDWLREGYLLISVRNINALVALDPDSGEIVHAMRMPVQMQHDIDYLPNGNFMIFDNRGGYGVGGRSRVLEFDPVTQEVVWQYQGVEKNEFDNSFWGEQQRLDNGNTMIVNAEAGRLTEVTPDKNIVWDYYIPHTRMIDGEEHIATITSAKKMNYSDIWDLESNEATP